MTNQNAPNKLSQRDHQRILDFYQDTHSEYGDRDVRSVHWNNLHDQITRFRALLQVEDISGGSVLDVGCGLGDLYKYLLQSEIAVEYTGIDIVPGFIFSARQRYPQGNFEIADINDIKQSYDYILASGALSFKVEDNQQYYQNIIKKMYQLADKAVSFNMLDNRIHTDNETYAAYSPIEVADFCSTFANRVEVAVDYLPQDFTIYLYK